jgi:hypothetical protein
VPDARVLTGGAGVGYVAGAAIENMGLLEAPAAGAAAAEVRAAYADHALQLVTSLAGALSLLCYCAFAFGLYRLGAGRWRAAGLGGALLGAALAAVALAASVTLVDGATGFSNERVEALFGAVDGANGLSDERVEALFGAAGSAHGFSDERVEALFAFYERARLAAGAFMALFLAGAGAAALRAASLPPRLARAACAIAPALVLGPLAAATGDDRLRAAAIAAFGLHSLWILCAGVWLALGREASPHALVRRSAFLVLALAAGLVGIALLAAPGATGRFFAWELTPEPLAAFAGGVYVGSALVYAAALRAPWRDVRGLVAAAAVLSTSVFAITLAHLDVFDFGRLQAWAWVALFALFGTVMLALLSSPPRETAPSARLSRPARGALGLVAAPLAAIAAALWIDPAAVSGPFELPPLGGRFAGSWIAMLAAMAGWAALRDSCAEARYAAMALVALPLGALAAALRGGTSPPAYVLALALLSATGAAVLAAGASTPRGGRRAPADARASGGGCPRSRPRRSRGARARSGA